MEFPLNTKNQTTVLHASPTYDILRAEGRNFFVQSVHFLQNREHSWPVRVRRRCMHEVGKSIFVELVFKVSTAFVISSVYLLLSIFVLVLCVKLC